MTLDDARRESFAARVCLCNRVLRAGREVEASPQKGPGNSYTASTVL
ncbi:hypothetical protein AWB66_02950 [Caballeronia telluris]|uniref:Uncharacterized protein n=1 Tax=Caballeronia telluris TaxID=326475 RepID=A0A158ICG0_9BURK|nr:hypothetical protein AWB66_02950 [Caballeronia telluris]